MSDNPSSLLLEDLAQLHRALDQSAESPGKTTFDEAGEELISLRIGWLYHPVSGVKIGSGWVSELEYRSFLQAAGRPAAYLPWPCHDFDRLDIGELLRPVTGVPYQGAVAFCEWITQRSRAWGEAVTFRLPTPAEALAPLEARFPSDRLAALFDERGISCWCGGSEPGLSSITPPGWREPFRAFVVRLMRYDLWFLHKLYMTTYIKYGMPPDRKTDWEFNENYEKDRRWVEYYASALSIARKGLVAQYQALDLDPGEGLDFNPLWNLGPLSPLDRYRGQILTAYRRLIDSVATRIYQGDPNDPYDEKDDVYSPPVVSESDREDLLLTAAELGSRGVDPERTRLALDAFNGYFFWFKGPWFSCERVVALQDRLGKLRDAQNLVSFLERMRFDALEEWLSTRDAVIRKPSRLRRWLKLDYHNGSPPGARRALRRTYCELAALGERLAGRIAAFEGIRLVHE